MDGLNVLLRVSLHTLSVPRVINVPILNLNMTAFMGVTNPLHVAEKCHKVLVGGEHVKMLLMPLLVNVQILMENVRDTVVLS